MSATPTQTWAELDEEEALHYRAMARRLADVAMEMAEVLLQHARSNPEPDHTIRFERVSRTVRRAILLARKLAEPLPHPRPVRNAAANPVQASDGTAARKQIIREVEDAIHREHRKNPRDVEALEAELLDRLDRPDLEADLATRPIEHIIAELARDLGVGSSLDKTFRVWKPRTNQDIADLEAHAAEAHTAEAHTTEPRPPKTASPMPLPLHSRIELPEDDAEAVAMVLAPGKIRDG